MALSGSSPKAKPSETTPKLVQGFDLKKLGNLGGIQEIIDHLKKGDWSAMVGAIMTMWKEYFGTPEEKAEIAKVRKEAKQEKAKKKTHEDLGKLQKKVEGKKEVKEEAEAIREPELVKNPDLGDGREFVLIGDSAAHGMQLTKAWESQPSFIGKDGMSTYQVLERLKAEKKRLKGKKKAMIYCAGNNILSTSTEDLVSHMIEMATICSEAGVPEIIELPAVKWSPEAVRQSIADLRLSGRAKRRLRNDGFEEI